jgi:spermidine synthase
MPDRSRHSTRIRLEEPITPFDACRHDVSRILIDEQTEFQRLQIVESPTLGRALILDEKWQSSTSDAHIYHEPLVHGAMLHHALANDRPGPRSVLIAGGGDWMSAREALRWKSVERVVLAEIDQRVLDASRYHFPEFHAGCEDDPRLEVIVGDATAVLDEASSSDRTRFDVIIGDLSDPIEEGPAADLFTVEAYQRVHAALTPGGVFATQAGGVAPAEAAAHARTRARLHRVFERAFTAIARARSRLTRRSDAEPATAPAARPPSAVPADDRLDDPLHLAELHADRLEVRVRRLQADVVVFLVEGLERGAPVLEQRDDAVPVLGDLGPLEQDVVPVEDALVAHAVAVDAQREAGLAARVLPVASTSDRSSSSSSATFSIGYPAAIFPTSGSRSGRSSSGTATPSAIDKERALFRSRTSAPFLMSASTCSNTVTLLTPISSASSCIVGE